MDWPLFASSFALVFVVELPGKTTMATALMASRLRPWPVFFGACGAFAVHSLIAVMAGGALGLLPERAVKIAVGFLFLSTAVWMWLQKDEPGTDPIVAQAPPDFWTVLSAAFMVTFLAQWGDPSQIATAALAAKNPKIWTVFAAAASALCAVSALAVVLGGYARARLQPRVLRRTASAIFAAVGLAALVQAWLSA